MSSIETRVATIIRNEDKKILIIKSYNRWVNPDTKERMCTIPGKRQEYKKCLDCTARDLVESYGFKIKALKEITLVESICNPELNTRSLKENESDHINFHEYLVEVENKDPDFKGDWMWVNPYEALHEHKSIIDSVTTKILEDHLLTELKNNNYPK